VIVLDASAAIEWLIKSSAGTKVDRRLFSLAVTLHVPHLLDVEIAQVLSAMSERGLSPPLGAKKPYRISTTSRSIATPTTF